MKIIGICSKMGCGKDYIAENFIEPFFKNKKRYLRICFADELKQNVLKNYKDIKFTDVFCGTKTSEIRSLLQKEGTENGRNKYGKDIWIRCLENQIKMHSSRGVEIFIITDVRFENEINFIKSLDGHVIYLHAPNRNLKRLHLEGNDQRIMLHQSETELNNVDKHLFDLYLENDENMLDESLITNFLTKNF